MKKLASDGEKILKQQIFTLHVHKWRSAALVFMIQQGNLELQEDECAGKSENDRCFLNQELWNPRHGQQMILIRRFAVDDITEEAEL